MSEDLAETAEDLANDLVRDDIVVLSRPDVNHRLKTRLDVSKVDHDVVTGSFETAGWEYSRHLYYHPQSPRRGDGPRERPALGRTPPRHPRGGLRRTGEGERGGGAGPRSRHRVDEGRLRRTRPRGARRGRVAPRGGRAPRPRTPRLPPPAVRRLRGELPEREVAAHDERTVLALPLLLDGRGARRPVATRELPLTYTSGADTLARAGVVRDRSSHNAAQSGDFSFGKAPSAARGKGRKGTERVTIFGWGENPETNGDT